MMNMRFDPVDQRLLDEFQRDFPLLPNPFKAIGTELDLREADVIDRLRALQAAGSISRIGATVRPNTAGASTLAALAVPLERIEEVAAIVGQEEGVNHSYLREDDWNLWFVATASDEAALNASLSRIRERTGLKLLDLRLVRPFNIDLGFRLNGKRSALGLNREADTSVLTDADRPILQALCAGLELTGRPFLRLGQHVALSEPEVIDRIRILAEAGILTRIGVIVRHRSIGWASNAMVVWDVPEDQIEPAGRALAAHPGVTLCYQRRTVPGVWPYGLYSMIHARSRSEAMEVLSGADQLAELVNIRRKELFSVRCFKQRGALLMNRESAA